QPLRMLCLPACRDVFEPGRLYLRVRLDEAYAGIAAAQLPADLFLEFVEGLHRIPARRPESGDKRRRGLALIALHREGHRRIRVIGRFMLVHIDVGSYRRSAAVAVALPWDLAAREPETRARGNCWKSAQSWHCRGYRSHHVIEDLP